MRIIFVSLAVVIIDQISKLIVKGFSIPFLHINYVGMRYGETIQVIGNFFRITFIENPGLAFGFNPGINYKLLISLFSLFASIALIIYLYVIRKRNFSTRFAVALILGGAVGNLIDRMFYGLLYGYAPLFYGKVVDFLDFDFVKFSLFGRNFDRWPIFNFADAAVTIGVLMLVFFYPKSTKEREKEDEIDKQADSNLETVKINNDTDDINNDAPKPGNEKEEKILKQDNVEPNNGKEIPDTNS